MNCSWKVFFFSCLLFSALCQAQNKIKTPVVFDCTCEDGVGSLYATKFRDILATSPRYEQVPSTKSGKTDSGLFYWEVSVVSMDDDINKNGISSALSVAILIGNDVFVTQSIQVCGKEKVAGCAERTLAALDEVVSK